MNPAILVVALLVLAALAVAFGAPVARRRRTVYVERDRPVRRVVEQPVVQTHVVRTTAPVVEEIVDDSY